MERLGYVNPWYVILCYEPSDATSRLDTRKALEFLLLMFFLALSQHTPRSSVLTITLYRARQGRAVGWAAQKVMLSPAKSAKILMQMITWSFLIACCTFQVPCATPEPLSSRCWPCPTWSASDAFEQLSGALD